MVSNVEVADGNLKISFNTDAGHEDINIPISAIFNANNYYTKIEIDTKVDDINSQLSEYGQTTSQALNDLATRLTEETSARESGDNTLQGNIDSLSSSTDTKIANEASARQSADTTLQSNIDALSGDTKSKIDAEAQTREAADTTLQGNIDNVNSALTAHTANITVHVTQADKDKWNTPTDLSNYYTKSEVDEKDAAINATIEAYGHVTSQALNDLGTRMDDYGQVTSQALNDLGTKFGDYYTKTEVDSKDATINATIEALSSDTKNKIDAEASARQEADNTLQGNINNVNPGLTAHTANTTVHVTQADKDKWNTPTDLSNYYKKEEVDEAIANIDVTEQLQNYYTKTEIDTKVDDINSTIESYGQVTSQALNDLGTRLDDYGKVTSQSLNDLSTKFGDYYTKTEVDTAISNVDVTSQLQNYYTKTEVDSKDATLQTALDALDAHVSENEDIVSQSLNDLNNRIGNTYVKSYIDALEARIAELETKFLNMENNGLQAGEY